MDWSAALIIGLTSSGWIAAWWGRGSVAAALRDLSREEAHSRDLAAQALAAEVKARRIEALNEPAHSDPLINAAFAAALRALPPAAAKLVRGDLDAARRKLHEDGDDPGAGGSSVQVPDGPQNPFADVSAGSGG